MKVIGKILANEATGGCLLLIATVAALVAENSALHDLYHSFLHFTLSISFAHETLTLDTHAIINDLLMAIFFFLIGIEIKREMLEGHLSSLSAVAMPGVAAIAGMVVPAIIYVSINSGDSEALNGWAIPSATDIAFALGVLAILGKRVPYTLKLFLLTVAVLDDLGAILIIALFYTKELHLDMLGYSAVVFAVLVVLNWLGVYRRSPYVVFGGLLWFFVHESGIHATIAGVLLAFTIPCRIDLSSRKVGTFGVELNKYYGHTAPAERMEHSLSGWVTFVILPLFAFTNAGVPLSEMGLNSLGGVTLGIAAGLALGKVVGIHGACVLMFNTGFAKVPEGCKRRDFLGISMLCGIGFTMSLFITGLSFDETGITNQARVGILVGSLIAAIGGYGFLYLTLGKEQR